MGGRGGTAGSATGGMAGMSGAAGTDGGGTGGACAGCLVPPNQGNACMDSNVLWVCMNDHDFEQFQDNCDDLPTGMARYCCPSSFTPDCG